MAGRQLGEAVVNGVGRHGATAGATDAADQTGAESGGLRHPHPGLTTRLGQGRLGVEQQLIAQHPRHLHGHLHQGIAAGAAAHRRFVPLGHGIGDTAHQRASGGPAHQSVVEHQQVGAALQGHIPLEGALGGIEIGQSRPARTGGGTGGHRDAAQPEAIGQQLAGVEHLAAPRSDHSITVLTAGLLREPLQIQLTAVMAQLRRLHDQAGLRQIGLQLRPQSGGGRAAAEHQGPPAEGGDLGQGLSPGSLPPQNQRRGDLLAQGA